MGAQTQDELDRMLTRLKLTAVRDQLDGLLDEAARGEMTLREALAFLCEREIARKDQRRIEMSFGLAKFPFVRTLEGFDFAAQPSVDKGQMALLHEACPGFTLPVQRHSWASCPSLPRRATAP